MRPRNPLVIFLFAFALPATPLSAQTVLYVDRAAEGEETGESWAAAFVDLQDALDQARAPNSQVEEIRVAGGRYSPDRGTLDPALSFVLMPGLALRGGYAGVTAAEPDARDFVLHETILDGDLLGNDIPGFDQFDDLDIRDNSGAVVIVPTGAHYVDLDGLTIANGYGSGAWIWPPGGGGLRCHANHLAVTDCVFRSHRGRTNGAAVYGSINWAELVFRRCRFEGNYGDEGTSVLRSAGRIVLENCEVIANSMSSGYSAVTGSGSSTVSHCLFSGNDGWALSTVGTVEDTKFVANDGGYSGGGVIRRCTFVANSWKGILGGNSITDSVFVGNGHESSPPDGGAVLVPGITDILIRSCTFVGNKAGGRGGAVFAAGSAASVTLAEIHNSILWGNTDMNGDRARSQFDWDLAEPWMTYSAVENFADDIPGFGNTGAEPMFVDPDGVDEVRGTADDDLRLLPQSLLINAGDPDVINEAGIADLDGRPRVMCGTVDIGAYEFGAGDVTCDRQVTLVDFAHWPGCATGPGADSAAPECVALDLRYDGPIDLRDFSEFARLNFDDTP